MKRLGDTPAFKDVQTKGRVKHLDLIVRTGERLGKAVDSLDRESLKALADRMEVTARNTPELQRAIKRRILGVKR